MNDSELIAEGLTLLILGMGTVFVFLSLLVFFTMMMSSLLQKFFPTTHDVSTSTDLVDVTEKTRLLAIITSALHQHRSSNH